MDKNSTKSFSGGEITHSSFWANIFKKPNKQSELINIFSSLEPFKLLNKKEFELLLSFIHNRNYVPGEYIFYQNDPGIGFYVILEGNVAIQRKVNENIINTISKLGEGDFFGELALSDNHTRTGSAVALDNCRIAVIFKQDLDDFISKFPRKGIKILEGFNHIIAERLRKLNDEVLALQDKVNNYKESNYEPGHKENTGPH
jgi:CRP/FNR family transcriptional regulator